MIKQNLGCIPLELLLGHFPNLSPLVREMHEDISNTFKDSYIFEFLNLPEQHSEHELQKGLIRQMFV